MSLYSCIKDVLLASSEFWKIGTFVDNLLQRCMGTTSQFSIIFTKGNNFHHFLFASCLEDVALPNRKYLSPPKGANSFL